MLADGDGDVGLWKSTRADRGAKCLRSSSGEHSTALIALARSEIYQSFRQAVHVQLTLMLAGRRRISVPESSGCESGCREQRVTSYDLRVTCGRRMQCRCGARGAALAAQLPPTCFVFVSRASYCTRLQEEAACPCLPLSEQRQL